jgi:hypothetical protein
LLAACFLPLGDEPPQRGAPVGGDPVEERSEVLGGPDGNLVAGAVLLPLLDSFRSPDDGVRTEPTGQFDPTGRYPACQ